MIAKTNPNPRSNSFIGEVSCDAIEEYLFEKMVRAAYVDRECNTMEGLPESKILFIKDSDLKGTC